MRHGATTTQVLGQGPRETRARRPELPALHPRGVGELLDTGLDLLRERFAACVLLCAGLWVPVHVAELLKRTAGVAASREALELGFGAAVLLATLAVQSIAIGPVTVIVYGEMQGRPLPAVGALGTALRRAPGLLVTSLLTFAAALAGVICCFLPSIAVTWLFSVAPAALVLERLSPIAALQRSATLVRSAFLRWLGLVLTVFVLALPFSTAPAVLLEVFGDELAARAGLGPLAFGGLLLGATALLTGFATALGAVVWTLFYIDARVRSEGFDLVMRLERLRARRSAAVAR